MRIADHGQQRQLNAVSLYLTVEEAELLVAGLGELLRDPDYNDHDHVKDNAGRMLTTVLITPDKLVKARSERSKWTAFEREVLAGEWKWE